MCPKIQLKNSCCQTSCKWKKNIQSVGISGNEQVLSRDYEMHLTPLAKDSIYNATFSILTGYKFTEAKFTVNGQFELKESADHKIIFSENDTTMYNTVFDNDVD